jgi:hypothetical protein
MVYNALNPGIKAHSGGYKISLAAFQRISPEGGVPRIGIGKFYKSTIGFVKIKPPEKVLNVVVDPLERVYFAPPGYKNPHVQIIQHCSFPPRSRNQT